MIAEIRSNAPKRNRHQNEKKNINESKKNTSESERNETCQTREGKIRFPIDQNIRSNLTVLNVNAMLIGTGFRIVWSLEVLFPWS